MKCRQGKGFVALLLKQVPDFERIVLQNLASSSARVGVGAKHSGNNLSVKLEIFYPNASPVLFQQALFRDFLPVNLALPYLWS
ncbi:hypothetical protein [Microcystis aeruginosa]|uniref:hypothetical protein n=1 Tax=Microcystis aeruginosa TaxID=1126 RepID=UPI00232D0037|nr:hypothetical protein [Microcystis aeruginosa]MDB9395844.1 hypothetical protein [Microcystis aeruginosa CS-573]NCR42737.1 hypothetical protein [Microcystis aeruginosa W13-11]